MFDKNKLLLYTQIQDPLEVYDTKVYATDKICIYKTSSLNICFGFESLHLEHHMKRHIGS